MVGMCSLMMNRGRARSAIGGQAQARNGLPATAADRVLLKPRLQEAQRARREEEGKRRELAKERAQKILSLCEPAR